MRGSCIPCAENVNHLNGGMKPRKHVFGIFLTKSCFRWFVFNEITFSLARCWRKHVFASRKHVFVNAQFRWRQRFRCRKHVFANLSKKNQVISPKTILDDFALVKFRWIFQKKTLRDFTLIPLSQWWIILGENAQNELDARCRKSSSSPFSSFWKTIFYIATFCKKQSHDRARL